MRRRADRRVERPYQAAVAADAAGAQLHPGRRGGRAPAGTTCCAATSGRSRWLLLALLVAGAVYGAASWLRTKYWIEADELRVDTGVVSRQSRRIRVDRLQGIDIAQPFVARLFGLAELRMDVAGGGQREGSLAFLPLDGGRGRCARRCWRAATRSRARPAPAHDGVDGRTEASRGRRAPAPERVVARLDLADPAWSACCSRPETVAFVVAALVFVAGFGSSGGVGGVAGVVPVLIGFALTQVRRLSAYYGFTVTRVRPGRAARAPGAVRARRADHRASPGCRGWWSPSRCCGAGSAGPGSTSRSPATPRARTATARPSRLDGDAGGAARRGARAGPAAAGRVRVARPRRGAADPAADAGPLGRAGTATVHVGGVGEHLVVSREGMLTRRTHVVPHARVQSLRLHQGPWQRLLGLADLLVDSPPGPV